MKDLEEYIDECLREAALEYLAELKNQTESSEVRFSK
jgi:hypothetical protein